MFPRLAVYSVVSRVLQDAPVGALRRILWGGIVCTVLLPAIAPVAMAAKYSTSLVRPAEGQEDTAFSMDPSADLRKVRALLAENTYEGDAAAREILEILVQGRTLAAYPILADMVMAGRGGAQDAARAVALVRESAQRNNLQSMEMLAAWLRAMPSLQLYAGESGKWLRQAAMEGNPAAAFQYGQKLFKTNDRLKQRQGLDLMHKSAHRGYTPALTYLAYVYGVGEKTRQDVRYAIKLGRQAALQGDPEAQAFLGLLYQDTAREDRVVKSLAWLAVAYESGAQDVQKSFMALANRSTPQDVSAARQLAKALREKINVR
jgi:TPR repeat protein